MYYNDFANPSTGTVSCDLTTGTAADKVLCQTQPNTSAVMTLKVKKAHMRVIYPLDIQNKTMLLKVNSSISLTGFFTPMFNTYLLQNLSILKPMAVYGSQCPFAANSYKDTTALAHDEESEQGFSVYRLKLM